MNEVQKLLFEQQDLKYRDFTIKLIPNIDPEKIIGVRSPIVKKIAKQVAKEDFAMDYLNDLPHKYHEENYVHAGILNAKVKNIDEYFSRLDELLPNVDNWATSDSISPQIFKKYPEEVFEKVKVWIKSNHTYVRRFAIDTLMSFYLGDNFKEEHLDMVGNSTNEEYYVNMMVAWYFSMALVKQYDITIKYIEAKKLEQWTHNKTIQKAIESRQILDDKKAYLRTLKIKYEK